MKIIDLVTKLHRQTAWALAFALLVLYSVFQINLVLSERERLHELLLSWEAANKSKIEEYLYVENTLAVRGLLDSLLQNRNGYRVKGVAILSPQNALLASNGEIDLDQKSGYGFDEPFPLRLSYRTELTFSGEHLGTLVVQASHNPIEIVTYSLFAVLIACAFYFILLYINKRNLKQIRKHIVEPIMELDKLLKTGSTPRSALLITSVNEIRNLFIRYNELKKHELSLLKQTETQAKLEATVQITRQLAHDIRSPLTALDVAINHLQSLPEENRVLIRTAVHRIKDLANGLVKKGKTDNPEVAASEVFVIGLIESILSEKRIQYEAFNIHCDFISEADSCFSRLNPMRFKRVISNLLDNAYLALKERALPNIIVRLKSYDAVIEITIEDNGPGIAADIINYIGKWEISGRKDGTGLGLITSKAYIEEIGGKLIIDSIEGNGTKIKILINKCAEPKWFPTKLDVSQFKNVICVDDDNSILKTWKLRLLNSGKTLVTFNDPKSVEEMLERGKLNKSDCIFLVDYEFIGEEMSGLELIEKQGLQENSLLVTSYFEDDQTLKKIIEKGIKVIPKSFAARIAVDFG